MMVTTKYHSPYCERWQPTGLTFSIPKKGKPKHPPITFCYSIFFPGGLHATVTSQQRRIDYWAAIRSGRSAPLVEEERREPFKQTWHYEISGYATPDNEEFEDEKEAMAACEKVLRFLCMSAAKVLAGAAMKLPERAEG